MSESRAERIGRVVLTWRGVEAHPHRFGGTEYRLGRREIGHVHGQSLVDIPLPRRVRDDLVASGQARPHHVLPESGWVSVPMRSMGEAELALDILRLSYEVALAQLEKRRDGAGDSPPGVAEDPRADEARVGPGRSPSRVE